MKMKKQFKYLFTLILLIYSTISFFLSSLPIDISAIPLIFFFEFIFVVPSIFIAEIYNNLFGPLFPSFVIARISILLLFVAVGFCIDIFRNKSSKNEKS